MISEPRLYDTESSSVSCTKRTLDAHESDARELCASMCNKKPKFGSSSAKCDHCGKTASFGLPGGKKTHCGTHRDAAIHIDRKNAKCVGAGCILTASYGLSGGKRTHCGTHRDRAIHIDLKNAKCDSAGCILTASYGLPGGKRTHCGMHRDPAIHIDLVNAKCDRAGCILTASYGLPGGKRTHCGTHRDRAIHIDLVNKPCAHDGCTIQPCYGVPGGRPTHCYTHQLACHMNVVSPRCGSCTLQSAKFVHPRSTVNECRECDNTLWPILKKEEEAFAEFLAGEFGDSVEYRTFDRELLVTLTGCGMGVDRSVCGQEVSQRARLDFVFDKGHSCVVVVEVDEDQHKHYCVPSEIARANATINALFLGGNRRHVHIVRFNPDAFCVDGELCHVNKTIRYKRVVRVIRDAMQSNLVENTYSIQHMYYDVRDGVECIRNEIDPIIVEICRDPIIDGYRCDTCQSRH